MDKYIQSVLFFIMIFFYGFIVYFALIDGVTISENIILLVMASIVGISFLSNQINN